MKRLELKISGRVQGVTFRASTRKKARKLGLKGWVENRPDGTVEIVAEGDEGKLKKLLEWARAGPGPARVKNVEEKWRTPREQFDSFSIKY